MRRLHDLRVKLFADGAEIVGILDMARNPLIKGFTTNPTLMRKAGVADYEEFARTVLAALPDRPVSFEVFADDNIFQADAVGCHIITVTGDLLAKMSLVGKDLDECSLETVEMFRRDAVAAGYDIAPAAVAGTPAAIP